MSFFKSYFCIHLAYSFFNYNHLFLFYFLLLSFVLFVSNFSKNKISLKLFQLDLFCSNVSMKSLECSRVLCSGY